MKYFSDIISKKECLYRYRRYSEYNIEALKMNRLYFSNPKLFNDPYDNLLFANSNRIVSDLVGSVNEDKVLSLNKDAINTFPLSAIKNKKVKNKESIIRERIKIVYTAIDTIRTCIKKNSRIISFSEVNDSMLMWSHYADYHKGFLLVYDKESLKNAKRYNKEGKEVKEKTKLLPVEYVHMQSDLTDEVRDYIKHNMLGIVSDVRVNESFITPKKLRNVIIEKAMDWSYEKEWRLIPRVVNIEKESELDFIGCKPLAVIIGSQCQGDNRDELISICESNRIPVYGIYLSESEADYRLKINDKGSLEIASNEYVFFHA